MIKAADAAPSGAPTLGWWAAAAALLIVLLAPFLTIDVPPVLDYPNHLARYFVLAHPDDPMLSQIYAPHWRILPNLGMDVLGAALLKVTSVHVGGRILLALSLLMPVIGAVTYHRVVFGRFSYWPLAAGAIAFNAVFFLGFMNFLLSLGLALIGAAAWIALRRRDRNLAAVVVGAAFAALVFFAHIFGVALFALLIGSEELARIVRARREGASLIRELAVSALLLALALAPAVALYLASPLSDANAETGIWRGFAKLWDLLAPVMTTSDAVTALSGGALFVVLVLAARGVQLAPALPWTLAVLAVVFVAVPAMYKGGSFLDIRLAVMAAVLLFAGLLPRLSPRRAIAVAALVIAVIVGRSAFVAHGWYDHRRDLAELRAAIAQVEPGERVLMARGRNIDIVASAQAGRALAGYFPLDNHLGALLTIERRAFWPLMFADASQQPLVLKPAFAPYAGPLCEPVEPALLLRMASAQAGAVPRCKSYLADWPHRFDAVLMLEPPATPPLPELAPAYQGDYVALYRVVPPKPAPGSAGRVHAGEVTSPAQ
ncbi:hypothetical protein BJ123_11244 [Rhodopseudomonas thermotolerans]|uniref:4-amino-4-deoxy-L-arabinose transferase-like glycosyltransferase n=2 Tax=Rhodopseudomonas TaxID=1073 RepID=A0A336JPI2_9BRAD|nr:MULTISPECIES: hypothetical protein [Rhodopseudomonas]RED32567.1 hypothetical protein BJ125_11244 [Rhodopseudomonas pentothenatexigens]REF93577.1 hypothetical protein BJ123_11244 [Rhodopseudomonas thermotolerans]SSW91462.1 hypothetical protein SAMN05892882_11244 [Rhodopseudomonas pentothenatexigens]